MSADESGRPALRIVRGGPTADEVAALVAVVAAAGSAAAARRAPRPASSGWAAHDRGVRQPLGTGGWKASAAPR